MSQENVEIVRQIRTHTTAVTSTGSLRFKAYGDRQEALEAAGLSE